MRKSVIAGLALWAAFAALAGKTHARTVSQTARPAQAVSAAQQAMEECQARYVTPRGQLLRERWTYIEACFKEKTGLYPGQANVNCRRWRTWYC